MENKRNQQKSKSWKNVMISIAATLGVPTLDYALYALLNLLNPLVSITMAVLGVGLLRTPRPKL